MKNTRNSPQPEILADADLAEAHGGAALQEVAALAASYPWLGIVPMVPYYGPDSALARYAAEEAAK